jgi:phage-related protein
MKKRLMHLRTLLALSALTTLFWLGTPASAQTIPSQDNDTTRGELARFDQFNDNHPEIAEQVRKDPSLVNNEEFVEKHPALQSYLQEHPGIREELKENPNAFMRQENRFDRREDGRDRDTTRGELASFDQFMDSHREVAEQVRKNPSLVNNEEFVEKHPGLHSYLQQHPGVREEIKENPNAFMRQENRFDRREDWRNGDGRNGDWREGDRRESDGNRGQLASFGEFLGGHSNISQQLSKDPSLAKNQEYVANHPELRDYLKAHPGVREQLTENPQNFIGSAQQVTTDNGKDRPVKTPMTDPRMTDPRPKQ